MYLNRPTYSFENNHPIIPLSCSSVLVFACSCSQTIHSWSAIAHLPLSRPPLCSRLSSPTCHSIPSLPILIPSSYRPLHHRVIRLFHSMPANPAIDHTCLPAFASCPIPFPLSSPFSLFPAKSNFTWRTLNHAADIQHYGIPKKVISDRDPCFTSKFTKELCRILGIKQNISTAYHPQTDRQSKRTNQSLEQYLRIICTKDQHSRAEWLPLAQYIRNSWPSSTTKKAPYELILGYIPQVHQPIRQSSVPCVLCLGFVP
jgi:hypothetical protein